MMIWSIVRITDPGAICSHPVGRFEVYHLGSWRGLRYENNRLVHHVETHDMAGNHARELCRSFNANRFADNLGFRYQVEEVDEISPDRAPEKPV